MSEQSSENNSTPAPESNSTPAPAPENNSTPAPVSSAPPVQDDKGATGYKDTSNQDAAGYKEHKDPVKKEYKFDKTGHDDSALKFIEAYAENHELNDKQVEGFSKFIRDLKVKSDAAKTQSDEQAKATQHEQMKKDYQFLKDHAEFGKDLDKSFMEAGKVLDLMPEYKKILTASGKHVDPMFMLGLKGLYGKLFGQDGTIVQGGKPDVQSNLPIWDQIYGVKK